MRWPDSKDTREQQFKTFVEKTLSNSEFDVSLSGLTASLTASKNVQQSLDDLKSDPPVIIFREQLAVLLSYDGKPRYSAIENSPYERALNTPLAVVKDGKGNFYLTSGSLWYKARSTEGPWTFVRPDKLPAGFKEIPPASDIGGLRSSVAGTEEADQAVVDAQIPQTAAINRSETKLTVEYDGNPKFEAIKGTDVAYAVNTATPTGPWAVADTIPSDKIAEIPPVRPCTTQPTSPSMTPHPTGATHWAICGPTPTTECRFTAPVGITRPTGVDTTTLALLPGACTWVTTPGPAGMLV